MREPLSIIEEGNLNTKVRIPLYCISVYISRNFMNNLGWLTAIQLLHYWNLSILDGPDEIDAELQSKYRELICL